MFNINNQGIKNFYKSAYLNYPLTKILLNSISFQIITKVTKYLLFYLKILRLSGTIHIFFSPKNTFKITNDH